MFIVTMTYKKPLSVVDQFVAAHRAYLDIGYQQNFLIASGPKNPRDGGILISQLKERKILEKFLAEDPFILNEVAEFQIVEFSPVKYHQDFAVFV